MITVDVGITYRQAEVRLLMPWGSRTFIPTVKKVCRSDLDPVMVGRTVKVYKIHEVDYRDAYSNLYLRLEISDQRVIHDILQDKYNAVGFRFSLRIIGGMQTTTEYIPYMYEDKQHGRGVRVVPCVIQVLCAPLCIPRMRREVYLTRDLIRLLASYM